MAKPPVQTARKIVEPKTYSVWAKFNGMEFRKRTNDLDATIKELQPDWLHTDVFITVKKGTQVSERHLNMTQAKRLFRIDFNREVFISNLMLV